MFRRLSYFCHGVCHKDSTMSLRYSTCLEGDKARIIRRDLCFAGEFQNAELCKQRNILLD